MLTNLRTLVITSDIVYPPSRGAPLRNWQNINVMMEYGAVSVFSVTWFEIEQVVPPPEIDLLHYEYVLPSSKPQIKSRIDRTINSYYSDAAGRKLDELMQKVQPDLVIIEEIWLYYYLQIVKHYPCQIIFDNHNVEIEIVRQTLPAKLRRNPQLKGEIELSLEYERVKYIEQDLISQTSQTWVCSQEDASLLSQFYGQESNIYVVPNAVNVNSYRQQPSEEYSLLEKVGSKEHNIIFAGTFYYLPNKEAAEVLVEKIYPQLSKIYPKCRLLLVGQKPTDYMEQVSQDESGIIITGTVPDVRPYFASASVLVAPLFQGGGTRLKILEAFAMCCPVITTTKGAEGLKVIDGEHLLIRNTPDEMVAAVHQLWSEPSLAQKLAENAYQLVQSEYSWQAVKPQIGQAIQQLF